jgi:hypothetical protein
MRWVIRVIFILSITAFNVGCKLAVIVVEGGEVQSTASGTCAEGTICIHQVEDTSYSEVFTAIPRPGWKFTKWNSGGGFFCKDSTEPTCALTAQGAEGNEQIEGIIASDRTFYIMPIFVPSPPITDTVTFNGIVWAQADLFGYVSLTEMNNICPKPEGLCSGFLEGYDISGWIWASIEDVSDLLVSLGHPGLTYPPEWQYGEPSSDWAPAFYELGFRPNFESAGRAHIASTSTFGEDCDEPAPPALVCGVEARIVDRTDDAYSDFVELGSVYGSRGVWLYKPKASGP